MNSNQPDKSEALTERPAELPGRFETFVRRLFERIGGAMDFALRRPLNPQPRTDLTALIPPIERAIEEKLRSEGPRVFAPNLLELRYDYETWSQLTRPRVEYLQREVRATIYEYIHNRRYGTKGDIQVTVGFDVFTRGLRIIARFPGDVMEPAETAASASDSGTTKTETPAAVPEKRCQLWLKPLPGSRFSAVQTTLVSPAPPAGIGRSRGNSLSFDDGTVSAFHAAITLAANGSVVLSDLGSSNGTFVNGVRIASGDRTIIRSGDRVRFGDVEVTVELSD